jgi:hypothetical protein
MPGVTLTKAAYWARFFVKYGTMGIASIILVLFLGKTGWSLWKAAHPDPPPPPDMAFGRIPRVQFPDKNKVNHEFVLETPDGTLPDFGDRVKIYFIPRSSSTILALENAKLLAKDFDFAGEPKKINEGVYEFEGFLGYVLTVNALSGNFDLKYQYLNDQTLMRSGMLPGKDEAIQTAKAFLNRGRKLAEDLDQGTSSVSYYKIMPGKLEEAASLSEADLLRVDFFRDKVADEFRVVSVEADKASVSVLISGSQDEKRRVVEVDYRYVPVDESKLATYPIKPIDVAWGEVKAGQYYPAEDVENGTVIIRRVEMAYFEPLVGTNFFQPVFLFEGDKGFVAYVPALATEWTIDE